MRNLSSGFCKVIAVQNGNYSGLTATITTDDLANNVPRLYKFATQSLGISYIFWVKQEPYFKSFVIPFLPSNLK